VLPAGPQFQSSLRIRLQLAWEPDPDHGYPAEGALRLHRCRNKYVYVPVLSADHIMQFKFDAATSMLTPNDPPVVDVRAGAGPRHLTIHPNGKWGYLITETTATIGTYAIDKDKGTPTEIAFVDTGDYNGKDSTFGLGHPIGKWPTEKTPCGFNIDPRGKFLLSVGMDSAAMTVTRSTRATVNLNPATNSRWARCRTGLRSST
jgi:6-phosphogluconolactonase